ncbi:MAG: hypothetical protein [Bacteriophage sp.]|nr:MAG: hypothetical protein [Bacteriophage sp.]
MTEQTDALEGVDPNTGTTFGDVINEMLRDQNVYAYRLAWGNTPGSLVLHYGKFIAPSNITPNPVPSDRFWAPVNKAAAQHHESINNGAHVKVHGTITLRDKEGVHMGWTPSTTDMFARDWIICKI